MTSTPAIRVLVCDDHPMFREGVRGLIAAAPDLELAGEADAGDIAVELARATMPDVVLMDLQMPNLNGVEATRAITQTNPDAAVLMLTMFDDDSSVFAAMRAGARGYVLKGAGPEELLLAIQAAAHGEAIFSQQIARRLIDYFANLRPPTTPPPAFPQLTSREREVLTLVAQGHRNADIARGLFISTKTVTNHITNILNNCKSPTAHRRSCGPATLAWLNYRRGPWRLCCIKRSERSAPADLPVEINFGRRERLHEPGETALFGLHDVSQMTAAPTASARLTEDLRRLAWPIAQCNRAGSAARRRCGRCAGSGRGSGG